jgi:hypothetical protein
MQFFAETTILDSVVWILTSSAFLGKAAINADATIKANPLNVPSKY